MDDSTESEHEATSHGLTPDELAARVRALEARLDEGGHPWLKGFGAVATFLIALIGAVLGVYSYLGQQAIKVSFSPTIEPARVGTVDVGIVNQSTRAVNVVSGELLVDGQPVATINRFVPFVPDESDTRAGFELESLSKALPFSVGGGQSLAITMIFTTDYRAAASRRPSQQRAYEDALFDVSSHHVQLSLNFKPGNVKSETVNFGFKLPTDAKNEAADWQASIDLHRNGNRVFSFEGPRDAPHVATLRLWKGTRYTKPYFVATVPMPRGGADVTLPDLKRGRYAWSLTSSGAVVAIGSFTIPCPDASKGRYIFSTTYCGAVFH